MTDFTSPFDDMLAQSRREFDDLFGGSKAPRSVAKARPTEEDVAPETARFLDDRYGGRWRYEVSQRLREGDEVIVLGKLTVGDGEVSRSQFGRAQVGGQGPAHQGTAGGMAFTLGTGPALSPSGDPEAEAYRQAEAAALAKCAETL